MNSTLLQSDNFLKLISKHLPDMVWAKDLEGYYLYANESICNNLLMATPDEVIGKCDVFLQQEKEKNILKIKIGILLENYVLTLIMLF